MPHFYCLMQKQKSHGMYPEWELMVQTVNTLIGYKAPSNQIAKFVKGFPYKLNDYKNYDNALKYVQEWVYIDGLNYPETTE